LTGAIVDRRAARVELHQLVSADEAEELDAVGDAGALGRASGALTSSGP
jgi:hypothetical protein